MPADGGRAGRHVLTVSELTQHLKHVLEVDPLLSAVVVRGEISNFRLPASGHMYFTLKDDGAAVKCVMFRGQNYRLRFRPYDGLAVDIHGYISVYERDGQYQLYAQDMRPAGIGDLYLAFEQLKSRLAAEGLFSEIIKKPLPLLPKRVAIVTSPTGAAVRDILKVATRRCPGLNVVVIPAQVQGDLAAGQVARGIETANCLPDVDVIILTRGGGSLEELWAFNEEVVARAIRASRLPVVVGVGHEVDTTIADLAADHRAPTPSAAAEVVFPDCAALSGQLSGLAYRLRSGLRSHAANLRRRLDRLAQSSVLTRPELLVAGRMQALDNLIQRLSRIGKFALERRSLRLGQLAGRLDAMSPLAVLSRGYAVCVDPATGRVVRRAADVDPGDRVAISLGEGALGCRVETVDERRAFDAQEASQS